MIDYTTTRQDARYATVVASFLEDAFFPDLTLEGEHEFEELGYNPLTFLSPSIRWEFLLSTDLFSGEYDDSSKTVTIHCDSEGRFEMTALAHQMIHYYEHRLHEWFPERIDTLIDSLIKERDYGAVDVAVDVGEHDRLFILKSLDIDEWLEVPIGTTLGRIQESR